MVRKWFVGKRQTFLKSITGELVKGSDEPFGVIDLAKRGDLRLQWAMMVLSCPRQPRVEEMARQPDA